MLSEECETVLKKKLLMDPFHVHAGAKMISFGDWDVPAYYTSIIDEHKCVRERVGIFDVSHMGEIVVSGKDALAYLQYVLSNDVDNYGYGTAFYSLLCNDKGGIVDDVFVYPVNEELFFLVVNATNIEKDYAWFSSNNSFSNVVIDNVSDMRSMVACQGPLSDKVISKVFECDAATIGFHKFVELSFRGAPVILSASGYTGERGFEIMFDNAIARDIWDALLTVGAEFGIQPIGFGARDTLRIESGCPLYGHELSEDMLPYEARCGWVVKLEKEADFIGKKALCAAKEVGIKRKLFGLEMIERSIPRENYDVFKGEQKIGYITSGSYLPMIDKNAAMAVLDRNSVEIDDLVDVVIRSRRYKAKVIKVPFYKAKR